MRMNKSEWGINYHRRDNAPLGDDWFYAPTVVPMPIPLNIRLSEDTVILTWTNTPCILQAAPSPIGIYTNIAGANSPYTNTISEPSQFFRLMVNSQ
jgi:hypothetical protein